MNEEEWLPAGMKPAEARRREAAKKASQNARAAEAKKAAEREAQKILYNTQNAFYRLDALNSSLSVGSKYISEVKAERNALINKLKALKANANAIRSIEANEQKYRNKERDANKAIEEYNKKYNKLKGLYDSLGKRDSEYSILRGIVDRFDNYREMILRYNNLPTGYPNIDARTVRIIRDNLMTKNSVKTFKPIDVNHAKFILINLFIDELIQDAIKDKAAANAEASAPPPPSSPNNPLKTHYNILGLVPSVSNTNLQSHFRKISLKKHPNKGGDPEEYKKISNAYNTIKRSRGLAGGKRNRKTKRRS